VPLLAWGERVPTSIYLPSETVLAELWQILMIP
jgi:hypothetical protein